MISGIRGLSEIHKYGDNSLYDQSLVPVLIISAYDQQWLITGTNYFYDQSFLPLLKNSAHDQQFISTGTNSASNQQFVSAYTKTQIILLSYYPLSYWNLHTYSGYFHSFWVTHSNPNQNTYTNKVRLCVRYRLLYIQGVVGTKQFGDPNPHVDTHSDVGAVNQMNMSKKQEKINGTKQGNGT